MRADRQARPPTSEPDLHDALRVGVSEEREVRLEFLSRQEPELRPGDIQTVDVEHHVH